MGTPPAASRQTGSNQYKAKLNINASKPAGQPGSNLLAQADRAGPDPAALQTAARRQVWEEIASIEPLSHPDQIADVAYRSTSCPDDIKARLLLSSTTLPSRRGTKQLVDWVLQLAEPGPDALVKLAKKYPEHTMDIRRHPQWDSQLERHIAQTPDSLQAERRELYEQLGSKLRNGILPEAFAELTPKQRRQILRLAPASTLLKLTSDIWIADPPDQQNPAHGYSIGPGGTTSTGVRQRPLELLTGPEIETVWVPRPY
jgi:hypothetical protein